MKKNISLNELKTIINEEIVKESLTASDDYGKQLSQQASDGKVQSGIYGMRMCDKITFNGSFVTFRFCEKSNDAAKKWVYFTATIDTTANPLSSSDYSSLKYKALNYKNSGADERSGGRRIDYIILHGLGGNTTKYIEINTKNGFFDWNAQLVGDASITYQKFMRMKCSDGIVRLGIHDGTNGNHLVANSTQSGSFNPNSYTERKTTKGTPVLYDTFSHTMIFSDFTYQKSGITVKYTIKDENIRNAFKKKFPAFFGVEVKKDETVKRQKPNDKVVKDKQQKPNDKVVKDKQEVQTVGQTQGENSQITGAVPSGKISDTLALTVQGGPGNEPIKKPDVYTGPTTTDQFKTYNKASRDFEKLKKSYLKMMSGERSLTPNIDAKRAAEFLQKYPEEARRLSQSRQQQIAEAKLRSAIKKMIREEVLGQS